MFVAALLSLTLVGPAEVDPLAPAREGMAQCYTPNKAARTCRALATYEFHADGRIINYAEILMNPTPLVVMLIEAEVRIVGDAECSVTEPQDARYRFVIDGRPADPDMSTQLREVVVASLTEMAGGGEVCTTYAPNGDGTLTGLATIDGQPWPEGNDTLLWVDPAEGWKVAP